MASPWAACRLATCKFPILKTKHLALPLPNPGDALVMLLFLIRDLSIPMCKYCYDHSDSPDDAIYCYAMYNCYKNGMYSITSSGHSIDPHNHVIINNTLHTSHLGIGNGCQSNILEGVRLTILIYFIIIVGDWRKIEWRINVHVP